MKIQEYGGHPTFYFYSAHRDDSKNWIGTHTQDLRCGTEEELDAAVEAIRTGANYLKQYGYIQYLTLKTMRKLPPACSAHCSLMEPVPIAIILTRLLKFKISAYLRIRG